MSHRGIDAGFARYSITGVGSLESVILGIDTSLGTSVAVVEDDGVVRSQQDSADPRAHAEAIGSLIEQALREASVSSGDVTYVAVGMGPGPFTGLRVGIAAARAFALGRGVPLVPVVSHDAAALGLLLGDPFADPEGFAVVTDARRRELAYSVYDGIDDDGLPVRIVGPELSPAEALNFTLTQGAASGWEAARREAARREGARREGARRVAARREGARRVAARPVGPRRMDVSRVPAAMVALAASRAISAGRDIASHEALYLRSPDVTPRPVTA